MDAPCSQPEQAVALRFCLLEHDLLQNKSLLDSIRLFGAGSFLFCEEALNAASRKKNEKSIVFISAAFEGPLFNRVKAVSKQILGPPALARFASLRTDSMPSINRPLFSLTMENVVAVIDGFSEAQTSRIIRDVHNMGGLVIKKLKTSSLNRRYFPVGTFDAGKSGTITFRSTTPSGRAGDVVATLRDAGRRRKVKKLLLFPYKYPAGRRPTHLIAQSALCPGYRLAVEAGLVIATEEWAADLWRKRFESSRNTGGGDVILPVPRRFLFSQGCFLRNIHFYLLGFSQTDRLYWNATIHSAGGQVDFDAASSTHVIVINHCSRSLTSGLVDDEEQPKLSVTLGSEHHLFPIQDGQHFVDGAFLTASFSNKTLACLADHSVLRDGGPFRDVNVRKRRRSLELEPEVFSSPKRRLHRSTIKLTMPKVSSSSESPTNHFRSLDLGSPRHELVSSSSGSSVQRPVYRKFEEPEARGVPVVSKRQQRVLELLETEKNYVKILRGLVVHVKGGLEDPRSAECGLLDSEQIDGIFGNLGGIFRVHEEMMTELQNVSLPWDESCEVSPILLQHIFDISKSYPPFVNAVEDSKRIIHDSCARKPKLRAALKRLLSLPEFGRQTLSDLLIRPVQRLPTVLVLLRELHKLTSEAHPDHEGLQTAIQELERVLQLINDSKKAFDLQRVLRYLISEILNAPSHMFSTTRYFISELDAWESSSNQFAAKGDYVTFFLFNDALEIAKKRWRSKSFNPDVAGGLAASNREKLYRHVTWIPLHRVISMADMDEDDEHTGAFTMTFLKDDSTANYTFTALPEYLEKKKGFVDAVEQQLLVDSGGDDNTENETEVPGESKLADSFNKRALEKARKLASQTSLRVSKAFSSFAARTGGSGIKRAASMMLFSPAKNARNQPKDEKDSRIEE